MYMKNYLQSLGEHILRLRFYTSIETLPIEVWFKVHKTEDKSHIARNGVLLWFVFMLAIVPMFWLSTWVAVPVIVLAVLYRRIYEPRVAEYVWSKLYDQFIKQIGLTKDYLEYLDNVKQLAVLQMEWSIDPSPINKTNVRLKQQEIAEKHEQKPADYAEIIAQLSKAQGYRIDPKMVSVVEFYSIIKIHGRQ